MHAIWLRDQCQALVRKGLRKNVKSLHEVREESDPHRMLVTRVNFIARFAVQRRMIAPNDGDNGCVGIESSQRPIRCNERCDRGVIVGLQQICNIVV